MNYKKQYKEAEESRSVNNSNAPTNSRQNTADEQMLQAPVQRKENKEEVPESEKNSRDNWKTSAAMQDGMQAILPKASDTAASNQSTPSSNLIDVIQKQAIEGQEQTNSQQEVRIPPVAVPNVIDVGAIEDPVARNNQINGWYNMTDGIMNQYLGAPQVPSWVTYGQHASYNAGVQIRNLDDGIAILGHSLSILTSLVTSDPVGSFKASVKVFQTITGLLSQEGMVTQAMRLGFSKAGVTDTDIADVISAYTEATTFQWTDLVPGVLLYEQADLAGQVGIVAFKLAAAIPTILETVQTVKDNLVNGNTQIYNNIAPALSSFFAAANAAPDGNPGQIAFDNDPNQFLSASFALYGEVALLARQIECLNNGPEKQALIAQRLEKLNRANAIIAMHEQGVVAQPIFDLMVEELQAISGTMSIVDPNGNFQLLPNGGNWADLYTRMGMDPTGAPPIEEMTPDEVPEFDVNAEGTIGAYFNTVYNEDGSIDAEKEDKLHEAPDEVRRLYEE